jgi:hypothetical protein
VRASAAAGSHALVHQETPHKLQANDLLIVVDAIEISIAEPAVEIPVVLPVERAIVRRKDFPGPHSHAVAATLLRHKTSQILHIKNYAHCTASFSSSQRRRKPKRRESGNARLYVTP